MPSHEISALEELLGYRFRDRALIEQALTHSSYAREAESQAVADEICLHQADNEQMEFLGDAVLCLVVSQDLFRRFPEYTEGELSKLRAHIVSARHLCARLTSWKSADICALAKARTEAVGVARALCWSMHWRPLSRLYILMAGWNRHSDSSAKQSWSLNSQTCSGAAARGCRSQITSQHCKRSYMR